VQAHFIVFFFLQNNMLYRRAFSDVIHDVHSSRKEEARRAEFVRVGQVCVFTLIS
jgi:hypothetical protein